MTSVCLDSSKVYGGKYSKSNQYLILFISLTIYVIVFFIINYLFNTGVGIVAFIFFLVASAWFHGKKGGIITSIVGIVVNFIIRLIVGNTYIILNAFIQGIIFYPLVGLGVGHLQDINYKLEKSYREIKKLKKMLPICAKCKKIRDDEGYWNNVEDYIRSHSEIEFTHSLCSDCIEELYPDLQLDSE